jgi:hypothetical protein
VPGTIKVRTGSGDDLVRIQGVTGTGNFGSSSGKDLVQLIDSNFSSLAVGMGNGASTSLEIDGVTVSGRTAVRGGRGKDLVTVSDSTFGGPVNWNGGSNDDEFVATGSTFTKSVNLLGRGGADRMTASGSSFLDKVTANGGTGADILDFSNGNTISVAVKSIGVEDVRS